MIRNYRMTTMSGNAVSYSNIDDFTDSVREAINRQTKRIGQYNLMNASTTITLNRRRLVNPIQVGCDPCTAPAPIYEIMKAEAIISLSTAAGTEGVALLNDLITVLLKYKADYLKGFTSPNDQLVLNGTLPE